MVAHITERARPALEPHVRATLRARLERGVRRARGGGVGGAGGGGGGVLVGLTLRLAPGIDPSAVAFSSRREGEPWFCFEQPDRDGASLATVGRVRAIAARGPGRFARAATAWRELAGRAEADPPDGPAGAGLVAVGGFAFAPDGGAAPHWSGFGAGELTVPEVALARRGQDVRLTLAALVAPGDVPDELPARLEARLS